MSTPMMQQYLAAKKEHPDGILFFRMGDFFEMFFEDAERASELLGITLTSRSKGEGSIPMAGIPVRSSEAYVHRLVKLGQKVVLCDQVQDASEAKGLVERAITRVVTPGTVLEDESLEERDDNFLSALVIRGDRAGLASVDLSTGVFEVDEFPMASVLDRVTRADPAEVVIPEEALDEGSPYRELLKAYEGPRSTVASWRFDPDEARRVLCEQFQVKGLEGFGIESLPLGISAAGAALHYLKETQRGALKHVTRIRRVRGDAHLVLDRTTRASLEVVQVARDNGRKGSLLWTLDRCLSPMGARQLKRWLLAPLLSPSLIKERQDAVAELVSDEGMRGSLRGALKRVRDVERLLSRVACGRCSARELVSLRSSLSVLPSVLASLEGAVSGRLVQLTTGVPDLAGLVELLELAFLDEVPVTVKDGGLIRPGFDAELDELRALGKESKDWIAEFQAREVARTGIPLKIGFNRVFGYFIEVTRSYVANVPPEYSRRQTLKNAERYIVPELKEYEEKVLGAEDRINEIEYEHFLKLRDAVEERIGDIQRASDTMAELDVLQSLAEVAVERRYVRPEVDDSRNLVIKGGRHPVLDQTLINDPFVPNDVFFEEGRREFALITGPNMAGKSTYIRQAALLVLMAQVGSFVPAEEVRVGIVDRIFTRIGASDELARGNSTFMVEMIETADILNNASERSLVILDEVGRGTSTFDGLSIAWSLTEYLAETIHARTLFATHYHQLVDLASSLLTAFNLNVAVREWNDDVVFLHKIVEGGTDRSYGIHVARLAGLPRPVLDRAERILEDLENEPIRTPDTGTRRAEEQQLTLFAAAPDRLRETLDGLDLDSMTPIEALLMLQALKQMS